MHVPSLSSGCDIAPFFVRYMVLKRASYGDSYQAVLKGASEWCMLPRRVKCTAVITTCSLDNNKGNGLGTSFPEIESNGPILSIPNEDFGKVSRKSGFHLLSILPKSSFGEHKFITFSGVFLPKTLLLL
jgi:hypothetical protein